MKSRKPRPPVVSQFDPNGSMRRRGFERFFLLNRSVNVIISETGKLALSALIWPRFVAPFRWRLTRHPLPLAHLRPAFEGYRILHLTDLHVGKTDPKYLLRVIRTALAERPDLVVITGDLIDYLPEALPLLRQVLAPLAENRPPDGIIAIFGNHDYNEYSWRKVGKRSAHRTIHRRLVKMLDAFDIRLLRNEQFHLRHRAAPEARVIFAGLDEMWSERADPTAAFAGLTPADPVICLQHNPDGITFLEAFPWQYMLTGHSHGGQAILPLLGALYVPMEHREYLRGFYRFPALPGQGISERTMFVSTGLGYSTPIRMSCPPEATMFTLTAANAPAYVI